MIAGRKAKGYLFGTSKSIGLPLSPAGLGPKTGARNRRSDSRSNGTREQGIVQALTENTMKTSTRTILFVAVTAAALTQAKASSSDMYLTIGAGKGEMLSICSTASPVPGAGVEFLRESPSKISDKGNAVSLQSNGGGSGKASFSDLSISGRKAGGDQPVYVRITCADGQCATALKQAMRLGKPLDSITVAVVSSERGKASPKLYTLKNCLITALSTKVQPRDLATGQASGRKERKDMLTWVFIVESSSVTLDGAPLKLEQDLHLTPVPASTNSDN